MSSRQNHSCSQLPIYGSLTVPSNLTTSPGKAVHRLTGIDLGLPLISNFERNVDVFVQPSLSATINGKTFNLNGRTKPFADSLETTFDAEHFRPGPGTVSGLCARTAQFYNALGQAERQPEAALCPEQRQYR